MSRYPIARQRHLGDTLDKLARRGVLSWRWDYANRRAIYWISLPGVPEMKYDTKTAEDLVQRLCDSMKLPWRPVPHHGEVGQYQVVQAWMRNQPQWP